MDRLIEDLPMLSNVLVEREDVSLNGATAPYENELRVAEALARAAGAATLELYGIAQADHPGAASPVTAADRAANQVIVSGLRTHFPDDAILSEESADTAARLDAQRVWIVDPLDGTKEFLAMNGEFAVMIALAVDGEPVVAATYQPVTDTLLSAVRGRGAWIQQQGDREPLRCSKECGASPRLVRSRSHNDPLLTSMEEALGITETRICGSVGVKIGLLALGEGDLYIHPVPYLKEWDTCAPELILREAGGTVTDCEGGKLQYNKATTNQPHGIVAAAAPLTAHIQQTICDVYRRAQSTTGTNT
jgi:3'(2'), 5'-bisphosphate nucleotidase